MKGRKLSRKKLLLFRSLAILLGLTVSFVIVEVALRLFRPQPTLSYLQEMAGEYYIPGETIPFTLKPNVLSKMPSMEYPGRYVTISTNQLGLRGSDIAPVKPAGTKRILILGDSYTFGEYVGDEETYPAVLERYYREEDQVVEVVNAGYADGWSPDEHYAWLTNTGIGYHPDVIVYGFFIGNDIDWIAPEHWVERDVRNLPRKIVNPDIFVDDANRIRSRKADGKGVTLDKIYTVPVLRESHALVLVVKKLDWLRERALPKRRTPYWGDNPFPFILKPQTDTKELRNQERLFLELVQGMATVSAENGARFIVLMIPINFQVEPEFLSTVLGSSDPDFFIRRNYFEELKPRLNAAGVLHLDLLERMKAQPGKYFPRNGEVHFNPQGCTFTARCLKKFLDNHNLP